MITEILENSFNIKINKVTADIIEKKAKITRFKNKETVIIEGERASKLYFMISGIVRGYYIDEKGNDITKCFAAENQFFSTESFLTGNEATFTIEAIEECTAVELSYNLVNEILKIDSALNTLFMDMLISEIRTLENQKKKYKILDAENRYKEFYKDFGKICGRVDLRFIASYIGIRLASLSRIRNKL